MPQTEVCTQPECFLQEDCVDCDILSEMIVGVLTGETVAVKTPVQRKDRCAGCVQRILRGGRPFPTVNDIERERSAGEWARRRQRRYDMREDRRI
jgi:hypothetical protein